MRRVIRLLLLSALLPAAAALHVTATDAREFVHTPKANDKLARKLDIPVYFAVPTSARAELTGDIDTDDQLIDFKHPDAVDAEGGVGLRLIVAKRAGLARRLAQSGLVQTGDLLLTVRPEWAGGGPYPAIQMGISHTGLAYVKGGVVYNIDNPMSAEYLGTRGQLDSEHYRTLKLFHIVRPRRLNDAQRTNIQSWATRLASDAQFLYPRRISFNADYNAPKYRARQPYTFVRQLGEIALGQQTKTDMFCSEFAWSLLSLRNCDPKTNAQSFNGSGVPSCVEPIMRPMAAAGDQLTRRWRRGYSGLVDGPLMVLAAMKLPSQQRLKVVRSMFSERRETLAKMSEGHRQIALAMKGKFALLEKYYLGMLADGRPSRDAKKLAKAFNRGDIPDNYSPTSFLINTLLPRSHPDRTMDYVATVLLE